MLQNLRVLKFLVVTLISLHVLQGYIVGG